ncbi:Metallo-peptidase family M12-domain-containing protein [Gongronella butleri]|nr:Metallo-peptidase family M12-domain-containing protein [Gongronella butleri]
MGAAADCSYTTAYNGIRLAKSQILTDWNIASAVYERTFNISLGLIYLEMSKPGCSSATQSQANNWNQDCSSTYTISNRLSDFSFWRGQRGDDQASLWHLMTQCATGVKVGIAWLSQLCEFQASQQIEDNGSYDWVSGTGVSSIVRDEWKVVAHEVGHGFGAIHDCTPQTCSCAGGCGCCPLSSSVCSAGDTYLMNPTSNVTTNDFSPCSISDICTSFPNIGYCLKSPGDINNSTFHICGNGILEPGEQCDPGGTDTACCNAKNCTLKPQAQCDDYSSLCCINCGVAPQGTVCRPAASECDSDEVCSGTSTQCPADEYDPDGTPCANNTMQCASGICTSRDEQCVARGLRLNITHQCPFQEDSCQITCADPSDSQNCLVLSGIFLDGTECGLAGFCRGGSCVSSGLSNTINAWVQKNLNIAIPVFVFGGLFILALLGLLVWFIRRRYLRRRDFKDKNSRPSSISSSRYGDDGDNHHHGGSGGNNGRGGLPPPSAFGNTHAGPQLRAANLLGYVDTTPRHSQYSSTSHASHRTTPSMTPPATVESSTPSESWEMHTFSSYEQPSAQTPQLRHDTAMDPNKTTQTDDQSQISRRSIYPTDGNVVIATGAERRLSANWS